jgi:hypothetical protein
MVEGRDCGRIFKGANVVQNPERSTAHPGETGFAGAVETFLEPRRVLAWAADPLAPDAPVTLILRLRGAELGRLATGTHDRQDLFAAIGAAHGVILDLPEAYRPGDFATGRLALHPRRDGTEHPPLLTRPRLVAQERVAAGQAMLADAEAVLGPEGVAAMLALLGQPHGFAATQAASAANAELSAALRGGRPRPDVLSSLSMPVGTRSADGAAMVGRNGHLILLTGSNGGVMELGADPAQRKRLVAAWIALFAARRARAAALGIRYVQLIVPEKTSLQPRILPDPARGGPTPFLAALSEALAADASQPVDVLLGLDILLPAARAAGLPRAAMQRRLDTHPSAAGMHALARAILLHLGEEPPDLGDRSRRGLLAGGDLAEKFLPLPLLEEIAVAAAPAFLRFGAEPSLVAEAMPADEGHIGRFEHWQAAAAPSPRRMMAFGNSICGTGRAGQGLLSGWLARWFAEYRFHWQPEVDWQAVEAARPDILLCQTVERFMGRVPER